jgi:hypothetical protein
MATFAWTDLDINADTTDSFSFSSIIGSGDGNRTLIGFVAGSAVGTGGQTITAVTINGVPAAVGTLVDVNDTNATAIQCFSLRVSELSPTTLTSVTVTVTWSGSINRGCVCLIGVSPDPVELFDFGSDSEGGQDESDEYVLSTVLDVPADGIIIGGTYQVADGGSSTRLWDGITKNTEGGGGSFRIWTRADDDELEAETDRAITFTSTAPGGDEHGAIVMFAASFGAPVTGVPITVPAYHHRHHNQAG